MWVLTNTWGLFNFTLTTVWKYTPKVYFPVVCVHIYSELHPNINSCIITLIVSLIETLLVTIDTTLHNLITFNISVKFYRSKHNHLGQSSLATTSVSLLYLACCSSCPIRTALQQPAACAEVYPGWSCRSRGMRSAAGAAEPGDSSTAGARRGAARGTSGTSAVAAWGHVFTWRSGIGFRWPFINQSLTVKYSEFQFK